MPVQRLLQVPRVLQLGIVEDEAASVGTSSTSREPRAQPSTTLRGSCERSISKVTHHIRYSQTIYNDISSFIV